MIVMRRDGTEHTIYVAADARWPAELLAFAAGLDVNDAHAYIEQYAYSEQHDYSEQQAYREQYEQQAYSEQYEQQAYSEHYAYSEQYEQYDHHAMISHGAQYVGDAATAHELPEELVEADEIIHDFHHREATRKARLTPSAYDRVLKRLSAADAVTANLKLLASAQSTTASGRAERRLTQVGACGGGCGRGERTRGCDPCALQISRRRTVNNVTTSHGPTWQLTSSLPPPRQAHQPPAAATAPAGVPTTVDDGCETGRSLPRVLHLSEPSPRSPPRPVAVHAPAAAWAHSNATPAASAALPIASVLAAQATPACLAERPTERTVTQRRQMETWQRRELVTQRRELRVATPNAAAGAAGKPACSLSASERKWGGVLSLTGGLG